LHSPKVVRALTRTMQVPLGNKGAAAAATANLLNVAREAGVSLAPAAAERESPATSGVPRP
jgi:hypothetical protein